MIRLMTLPGIAFPFLVLLTLASTTGQAAALEGDAFRIFGTLDMGYGGKMTSQDADGDLTFSPTLGGTAGFDIGIGDFFALGVMGSMLSLKLEDDIIKDIERKAMEEAERIAMESMASGVAPDANQDALAMEIAKDAVKEGRSTLLDFAIYPRLRIPIPVMEIYVMVPIGYATFTSPLGESVSGMSIGVFGGLGMELIPFLRFLLEGGYAMYYLDGVEIKEPRFNGGIAIAF